MSYKYFLSLLIIVLSFSCSKEDSTSKIITVDMDKSSVNGVELGAPKLKLDKAALIKHPYPEAGYTEGAKVEIGWKNGFVDYFLVNWNDPYNPTKESFNGNVIVEGINRKFSKETQLSEIITLLGEPYWTDIDDTEYLLFYEFPTHEWQIEFSKDKKLRVWIVLKNPLMADEEQRTAYKVDKPYPYKGTAEQPPAQGPQKAGDSGSGKVIN